MESVKVSAISDSFIRCLLTYMSHLLQFSIIQYVIGSLTGTGALLLGELKDSSCFVDP